MVGKATTVVLHAVFDSLGSGVVREEILETLTLEQHGMSGHADAHQLRAALTVAAEDVEEAGQVDRIIGPLIAAEVAEIALHARKHTDATECSLMFLGLVRGDTYEDKQALIESRSTKLFDGDFVVSGGVLGCHITKVIYVTTGWSQLVSGKRLHRVCQTLARLGQGD